MCHIHQCTQSSPDLDPSPSPPEHYSQLTGAISSKTDDLISLKKRIKKTFKAGSKRLWNKMQFILSITSKSFPSQMKSR